MRSDLVKVLLECFSKEVCFQLLSDAGRIKSTPFHIACRGGDTASVRLMLQHVLPKQRYSLLLMRDFYDTTPISEASGAGNTDIMTAIYESVTATQWFNILHADGKEGLGMTVLQKAIYENKHASIEFIKNSVCDELWLQLLSTPFPEYNQHYHDEVSYQQAVTRIDELRSTQRVNLILSGIKNNETGKTGKNM